MLVRDWAFRFMDWGLGLLGFMDYTIGIGFRF